METDRECVVCKEDASYFCRMCSLHFCSEHLCLHLNVAWETNTWTHRNTENYDEDIQEEKQDVDNRRNGILGSDSGLRNILPDGDYVLQNTPKPLPAYSESELQAQYKFYLSQARRIRTELERRAISLESPEEREQRQLLSRRTPYDKPRRIRDARVLPKSLSKHIEVLLSGIGNGSISLEYIKAQMQLPPEQP